MTNFSSPLYLRTNPISDERICVGLFASAAESLHFAWSESKLKVACRLVDGVAQVILKKNLVAIEAKLAARPLAKTAASSGYGQSYFDYLAAYNDGLLEFGQPRQLPKPLSDAQFRELYKLYVGEEAPQHEPPSNAKPTTLAHKVKSYLQTPAFTQRTDRQYKVSETVISTIYRPQLVDFISCNGNLLVGHSIDFTAAAPTIEHKLYEFRALVEGLNAFATQRGLRGKGKYIAYFEPPQQELQTSIFNQAFSDTNKPFNLQPVEELADVDALLLEHDYRKFSALIDAA